MGAPVEWTLERWESFLEVTYKLEVGSPFEFTFLFRGQARSDWPLQPTLMRRATVARLNSEQTLAIERDALKEFQMQAHLYIPSGVIPEEDDLTSWWTLMQHYGAPTRLLDWTVSPFVAAYFAVEQAPEYPGAIWVVHAHTVTEFMKERYDAKYPGSPDEAVKTFLKADAKPVLYFVLKTTSPRTQLGRRAPP